MTALFLKLTVTGVLLAFICLLVSACMELRTRIERWSLRAAWVFLIFAIASLIGAIWSWSAP